MIIAFPVLKLLACTLILLRTPPVTNALAVLKLVVCVVVAVRLARLLI